MPREDGRDHGGVGQRLPFEELVLHALVGVPEIRLMERGDSEHGSPRGEDALPGMSLGLWRVWMRQPPLHWGARSCFVGAGTREAASAALCWLSPAVLGSPAAGCSALQMVPSSLGTTPKRFGDDAQALLAPGVAAAHGLCQQTAPGSREGEMWCLRPYPHSVACSTSSNLTANHKSGLEKGSVAGRGAAGLQRHSPTVT